MAAIAGIVIGLGESRRFIRPQKMLITTQVVLFSLVGIIFAVVRHRRIRNFQRSYVQNAQANAATMNMGASAPIYPSPAYEMPHHSHHMHHHDHAMDQVNMQNQINMQNQQNTMMGSGMGGSTGMGV